MSSGILDTLNVSQAFSISDPKQRILVEWANDVKQTIKLFKPTYTFQQYILRLYKRYKLKTATETSLLTFT